MINAKQKAIEISQKMGLVSRFTDFNEGKTLPLYVAKKLALICVNEMIEQNGELFLQGINLEYYTKANAFLFEIKTEIELL